MRVRYKIITDNQFTAECDLTEKQARKRFEELSQKGLCMWAELIGEDDNNYMEILDCFDHTEEALKTYKVMKAIGMLL